MSNPKCNSNGMDAEEMMDALSEARDHLFQAIDLITEVFPDDEYVKAYMIDPLKIRATADHGFLSSNLNIDDLMERVTESVDRD